MLQIALVFGVVLLIVCLIVRDQTEYRLSQLRSEFMFLRSEEKRLADRREEVELMVSQIGDGLMRAERRRVAIDKSTDAVDDLLDKLAEMIEGGGVGDGVAVDAETTDVETGDQEEMDTESLT